MLNIKLPQHGDIWQHYKDTEAKHVYHIIGCSLDTVTGDIEVTYCYLSELEAHNKSIFNRALGEFLGYTKDKEPRFVYLENYKEKGSASKKADPKLLLNYEHMNLLKTLIKEAIEFPTGSEPLYAYELFNAGLISFIHIGRITRYSITSKGFDSYLLELASS